MGNFWTGIEVSCLMALCVGLDIAAHKHRRSQWWIALAFVLGVIGGIIYFAYDRIKERRKT